MREQRDAARRGRPPVTDQARWAQRLHISRHAVRLFREQGVAATPGRQIAHAAEVSERTLWRLFRAKESCVEPLLTQALEAFQTVLGTCPPGLPPAEHLRARYTFLPPAAGSDVDAVLAVIRMTRDERALRAVWLVLHEQAETALAQLLARHSGHLADSWHTRLQAAQLNAALRVITEDFAHSAADGITSHEIERQRTRVADAFHTATHPHPPAPGA
ncbi:TetR/AcrR family transcriptional regulator [Streptomyces sp. NPDC054796]